MYSIAKSFPLWGRQVLQKKALTCLKQTAPVAARLQKRLSSNDGSGCEQSVNSLKHVEEIFDKWKVDPESVHKSWDVFFRRTNEEAVGSVDTLNHLAVYNLVQSYHTFGHTVADLDPLGLTDAQLDGREAPEQLSIEHWGLTASDLDKQFTVPNAIGGIGEGESLTLREIVDRLQRVYCHNVGLEFMFLSDPKKSDWIKKSFEAPGVVTSEEKRRLLGRLVRSTEFEFSSDKIQWRETFRCRRMRGCLFQLFQHFSAFVLFHLCGNPV